MIQFHQSPFKIDIKDLRRQLPDGSGVYIFKDHSGNIIYIGKAKNLKKRILSYFKSPGDLPYKTAVMMNRAEGLDYILTTTENEAFILESSLIKKHKPQYNIILRDDKQYPSLRLNIKEPYPRLNIVRKIKKDGAIYFGPFSSSLSVRNTLKLIDKIFRLRKCKSSSLPRRSRPCLNYQMGICLAPCTREVPHEVYDDVVYQVRLFLEGRNHELLRQLEKDMMRCADQELFEEAAGIRDQIKAVKKTIERQYVVSPSLVDQDVIGIAQDEGISQAVIMFVRKGYLVGSRDFLFKDTDVEGSEVLEAFLKQYYSNVSYIPQQILISEPVEDLTSISGWLSELSGRKVTLSRPIKGEKRRIVRMAISNAETILSKSRDHYNRSLIEMTGRALKLKHDPVCIEGIDISTLQGEMAVGTVVSFRNGVVDKAGYRNYRIREVAGIDDYGMMSELVLRRLSCDEPPDMFLLDGGKGHLQAVKRVLDNISGKKIPELAAIAKAREGTPDKMDKIYIPGRKNPLSLNRHDPVRMLLMRIRDEAHRRAVGYHRKLRAKGFRSSLLDKIPGIGPKKKIELLKRFADIDAISNAKIEELTSVPGISASLARDILTSLNVEKSVRP